MAIANNKRVAVIYDGFPHYRKGVIEELASSERYDYYFFADAAYRDPSINAYTFVPGIRIVRTRSFSLGPFHVQFRILGGLLRNKVAHCIFLGNPWFLSYWFLVPILRLLGRNVYFWTHGWISRDEPPLRGAIKSVFFGLSDAVLLYGHRAKEIGIARGFPAHKLRVIGNSLDYANQQEIFRALASVSQAQVRAEFDLPLDGKIIICTARVTQKCRFDLLMHAAEKLKDSRHPLFLLIVGDGPEKGALAELAGSLGLSVQFWGACYDESTIAKLYKASDLTVSPGKVGLTAIHSMAYGTPVISHDNFDHQMPEYETIVPGVTGDFFSENSSDALADVIFRWFEKHPSKPEAACIARIEAEFTPFFQRRAIETVIGENQLQS